MVGVRQFDEQEVIALALDVFWRKGLHDATMQDLAAATGVQRGSLYNAYGDKEAIFLRAFDQYAGEFLDTAAKALAEGDTAARLRNFFDVIIVNMTSGSPSRGCLTTRTALDAGHFERGRARARAGSARPAGADRQQRPSIQRPASRPRSMPIAWRVSS